MKRRRCKDPLDIEDVSQMSGSEALAALYFDKAEKVVDWVDDPDPWHRHCVPGNACGECRRLDRSKP